MIGKTERAEWENVISIFVSGPLSPLYWKLVRIQCSSGRQQPTAVAGSTSLPHLVDNAYLNVTDSGFSRERVQVRPTDPHSHVAAS